MNGASHILGIDVGVSGCIADLNTNTLGVRFYPLPMTSYMQTQTKEVNGKKIRKTRRCRQIDELETLKLIRCLAGPHIALTVIEHQAVWPGQGSVSSAKLLYCYGVTKTAVLAANLNLEVTKPSRWKRDIGLILTKAKTKAHNKKAAIISTGTYAKKKRAWQLCLKLFPHLEPLLRPMTASFDKAEACLLAHWGSKTFGRQLGLTSEFRHNARDNQPALL